MLESHHLRIEAAHKRISEVFSKDYAFTIPAYQRPYAWEETQVNELLTDLEEAMEPGQQSDGFYFLGSIVLVKQHGDPHSQVIDGQQRLTTLTILLSIVRDLTEDIEKKANRETYIKQKANEDEGIPETLRLRLREKDQSFFEKHIQQRDATNNLPDPDIQSGAKKRIVANAKTIRTRLEKMSEQRLSGLLKFVLQNCYLVVVEVPTQTAARRIFRVLNTRGMDLSATDILKAQLLDNAGEAKEESLSKQWEDIEVALGRDKFSDLFTHIRMIFERAKPRSALETGFPEEVPIFHDDPIGFVNNILEPYADALMLSMNYPALALRFGTATADLVRSLDRLDNKDWLPPLLLCLRQSNEGKREDVPEIVFKIERVAYYLFMTRSDINARISRYADVLDVLEPQQSPKSRANDRERSTALALTKNECFALFDALNGEVYLSSRVAKPILLRLEQASTDGSANFDYPTISVEHVCPQTLKPGSQWSRWFPDEDERSEWLHTLGNLVLLNRRKNSAASNYDFDVKKDEYFADGDTSPFTITNEVREYNEWKQEDIEARQYQLIERLANKWAIKDDYEKWWESA